MSATFPGRLTEAQYDEARERYWAARRALGISDDLPARAAAKILQCAGHASETLAGLARCYGVSNTAVRVAAYGLRPPATRPWRTRAGHRIPPEVRRDVQHQWRRSLSAIGYDPDGFPADIGAMAVAVDLREAGWPTLGELAARYGLNPVTASTIVWKAVRRVEPGCERCPEPVGTGLA